MVPLLTALVRTELLATVLHALRGDVNGLKTIVAESVMLNQPHPFPHGKTKIDRTSSDRVFFTASRASWLLLVKERVMEFRAAVDSASVIAAVDAGRVVIAQTVLAESPPLHDLASMFQLEVLEERTVHNAMIFPAGSTLDGSRWFLIGFFRRVSGWPPFALAGFIRHSEIHYTLILIPFSNKLGPNK